MLVFAKSFSSMLWLFDIYVHIYWLHKVHDDWCFAFGYIFRSTDVIMCALCGERFVTVTVAPNDLSCSSTIINQIEANQM